MTTFHDDFVQLEFESGTRRASCSDLGITWPPPAMLIVSEIPMARLSMSQVTDEERTEMDFLMRGALYVPLTDPRAPGAVFDNQQQQGS